MKRESSSGTARKYRKAGKYNVTYKKTARAGFSKTYKKGAIENMHHPAEIDWTQVAVAAGAAWTNESNFCDLSTGHFEPLGRDQQFAIWHDAYLKSITVETYLTCGKAGTFGTFCQWWSKDANPAATEETAMENALAHGGTVKQVDWRYTNPTNYVHIKSTASRKAVTGNDYLDSTSWCQITTSNSADTDMYLHTEFWNDSTTAIGNDQTGLLVTMLVDAEVLWKNKQTIASS